MTDITISKEKMYELLISADDALTLLGLDLMNRFEELTGDSLGWDPDAYYTPLENRLHNIAQLVGYDYVKDIAPEAYRRRKEEEE